jgi:hypothetical protein
MKDWALPEAEADDPSAAATTQPRIRFIRIFLLILCARTCGLPNKPTR